MTGPPTGYLRVYVCCLNPWQLGDKPRPRFPAKEPVSLRTQTSREYLRTYQCSNTVVKKPKYYLKSSLETGGRADIQRCPVAVQEFPVCKH